MTILLEPRSGVDALRLLPQASRAIFKLATRFAGEALLVLKEAGNSAWQ